MSLSKKEKEERRRLLRERQRKAQEGRKQQETTGTSVLNFSRVDGDILWYRAIEDKNLIDIIPFIVQADLYYKLLGPDRKRIGVKKGSLEYKLEVPVHRNVGPEQKSLLCLRYAFNEPCFVCEQKQGLTWAKDEAKMRELTPIWRDFYNVMDLLQSDGDIRLWEIAYRLFEKDMLDDLEDEEIELQKDLFIGDLEDGVSIQFKGGEDSFYKEGQKVDFLRFKNFKFRTRKTSYPDSILKKVYPLDLMLRIPTYEEGRMCYLGLNEEETIEENTGNESADSSEVENVDSIEDMDVDALLAFAMNNNIKIEDAKYMNEKRLRKAIKENMVSTVDKDEEKCAYGHVFAVDCDQKEQCDDCEKWIVCVKAQQEKSE